jgi:hypothetical protein
VGVVSANEDRWSQRPLAEAVRRDYPRLPVYLYREYEELSSLPFYLGGAVPVIDSVSADLYYGLRLKPEAAVRLEDLAAKAPALVVVHRKSEEEFERRFPRARRLPPRSESARVFLVTGPPAGGTPPSPATRPAR